MYGINGDGRIVVIVFYGWLLLFLKKIYIGRLSYIMVRASTQKFSSTGFSKELNMILHTH